MSVQVKTAQTNIEILLKQQPSHSYRKSELNAYHLKSECAVSLDVYKSVLCFVG